MEKSKVEDYMLSSDQILTVASDIPLAHAANLMQKKDLVFLPVVENGRFLGIVTRQTIEKYFPNSPQASPQSQRLQQTTAQTPVGDVMESDPTAILPDVSIKKAAKNMLSEQIDSILVIDENDVWLGVLRLEDILNMIARS